MITSNGLLDKVIKSLDDAVNASTTGGVFNPSSYNRYTYMDAIYSYVKMNGEIQLNYVGTIGTTPDPLNGIYTFTPQLVSTTELMSAVINAQSSITKFAMNEWWNALINSIRIVSSIKDASSKITLSTELIVTPTVLQLFPDITTARDYKSAWTSICDKLVLNILGSTSTLSIPCTSSGGGTGVCSFVKVK